MPSPLSATVNTAFSPRLSFFTVTLISCVASVCFTALSSRLISTCIISLASMGTMSTSSGAST